jgi:hypothetical protein
MAGGPRYQPVLSRTEPHETTTRNVRLRQSRQQGACCLLGAHCPNWIPVNRRKCFPFKPVLTPERTRREKTKTAKAKAQRREERSRGGPIVALRGSRTLPLSVKQEAIRPGRITRSAG